MEEVNCLSPFAVEMDSPSDLINPTEYLFRPPKGDQLNNPKNEDSKTPYDNDDIEEDNDAKHTCIITPSFVKNINSLDLDKYKDRGIIDSADVDENND